jgi:hypothetical protein
MSLIRWEKNKYEMMGRLHVNYRGMIGNVELCTVDKYPRRKDYFYCSMSIRDILGWDCPHTKTPKQLMRLIEERYAAWLKEAGIIPFTEDLANEVIGRIDMTAFEEGGSEEDEKLRAWIEDLYPSIREHREDGEYKDWLWAVRVEADPRVKGARKKLDAMGHSDERKWQKALDDMFAAKGVVLKELMAKDQKPLKAEWKKDKDWRHRIAIEEGRA